MHIAGSSLLYRCTRPAAQAQTSGLPTGVTLLNDTLLFGNVTANSTVSSSNTIIVGRNPTRHSIRQPVMFVWLSWKLPPAVFWSRVQAGRPAAIERLSAAAQGASVDPCDPGWRQILPESS